MYSSDRMEALIRLFKDYDKNIVFMDCQIHFFKYLFEKKGNPLLIVNYIKIHVRTMIIVYLVGGVFYTCSKFFT